MTSNVETAKQGAPVSGSAGARQGRRIWWLLIAILFAGLLGTRIWLAKRLSAPKPLLALPAYTLTDQHGKPFGAAELRGKAYIADFVFTSCPSVCPRLTKRMVEIQRRTADLGDALHLVTFSVDPETDTPERLAEYARKYEANEARWTFLTGPLGDVETVVVKGFKMVIGKTETSPGILEIFHGERLVLVDGDGMIRAFYEADDEGIENIVRDAHLIADR